jgi:hypothetical protein
MLLPLPMVEFPYKTCQGLLHGLVVLPGCLLSEIFGLHGPKPSLYLGSRASELMADCIFVGLNIYAVQQKTFDPVF